MPAPGKSWVSGASFCSASKAWGRRNSERSHRTECRAAAPANPSGAQPEWDRVGRRDNANPGVPAAAIRAPALAMPAAPAEAAARHRRRSCHTVGRSKADKPAQPLLLKTRPSRQAAWPTAPMPGCFGTSCQMAALSPTKPATAPDLAQLQQAPVAKQFRVGDQNCPAEYLGQEADPPKRCWACFDSRCHLAPSCAKARASRRIRQPSAKPAIVPAG